MTDKKVWMITGASRGMGVDFATAALAAGHGVVATGRRDPGSRSSERAAGGQAGRHQPHRCQGGRTGGG